MSFFSGSGKGGVSAAKTADKIAISASTPSKIAWGYGKISGNQAKLLENLSKPGRWVQTAKGQVSPVDLAALTAHTGDEFGLFTLGSQRIVVRGSPQRLIIQDVLSDKLLSQGWKWSAHTHPGISDNVLMSSGADRATLEIFTQSKSLILNSAGRSNVFNLENDNLLSDEVRRELGLGR